MGSVIEDIARWICGNDAIWDELSLEEKREFREDADQILSLVCKRIEGVENPYSNNVHLAAGVYDGLYRDAFEKARQAILDVIKEE